MKSYVQVYFDFFGYDASDFIPCEMCNAKAVDISHIEAKGRRPDIKDDIFNLMALCRPCHIEFGDKKQHKDTLREMHLFRMAELQPRKTEEMLNEIYDNLDLNEINNQL